MLKSNGFKKWEREPQIKHPDLKFVKTTIQNLLGKRKFRDWEFVEVEFTYMPGVYHVSFKNKAGQEVKVEFFMEVFDQFANDSSKFALTRIKDILKKSLIDTGANVQ